MTRIFRSVLVANRGEIALRIIRSARELGLRTIAVCSDLDRDGPWCHAADTVVPLGGATPAESYLRIDKLLDAAARAGAEAIHPGYGFLSENPAFAQAVLDAGLVFVGPPPAAMAAMGDKLSARRLAVAAGVPTIPGAEDPDLQALSQLGLPVLLKAAGGGGGKGMREVNHADALVEALAEARAEAQAAFGDPRIYVERRLVAPRHIEIQVLADAHGGLAHLGERECSIQRRHQKLIEECPSPVGTPELRAKMGEAALRLVAATGYLGVGTVEFLVDADGAFYFLEMNTRIQVEHPVTEAVWGVDLVAEQLRIAQGARLSVGGATPRGHAIECRIIAEDPAIGFLPSPGRITRLRLPEGPGVRVDAGVEEGTVIPDVYDPLLLKLIVWGPDRASARRRMVQALSELVVMGPATTAEVLRDILESPAFVAGDTHTGLLPPFMETWVPRAEVIPMLVAFLALGDQPAGAATPAARAAGAPSVTDPWASLGAFRIGP